MTLRFNQSGLLFVPVKWQRVAFVRWLRRIHAWTGFWGAVLFFVLGLSGVLLNHRSIMKLETGEAVEVSAMEIAVDPARLPDRDALGRWAAKEFDLTAEPRPPRRKGGAEEAAKGGERKSFLGRERPEAEKWELAFSQANGKVTVEYTSELHREWIALVAGKVDEHVLVWVNSRMPASPRTRPKPESFMPPNGACGAATR
jgi:uncharacterized protein